MNRKGLAGTIVITVLAIALAVILLASFIILKLFVVQGGQMFPRNREVLDLRTQAITPEDYDALIWKMPDTQILWSVPFQGSYYDSSIQELTITHLKEADVGLLVYFPQLEAVNAQSCTDYGALKQLYLQYPQVEVRYTIPIGGRAYGPDTETVILQQLTREDIALMEQLPRLTQVDGTGCRESALLQELEQTHPQWDIVYLTSIAGTKFSADTQALEVTGAEFLELYVGLSAMPELKTLTIHNPQASGEELMQLREEYPQVSIDWDVKIFGRTYPDDTVELDISAAPVGSIEAAKEYASKFPQLTKLIVDSGSIPHEDMAAFREEMRSSYKVVWTVVFTEKFKARTDAVCFMPSSQNEGRFNEDHVYAMRYFEDLVCIDVGHMKIKTVDFVTYMPHLKYLILADTSVEDITPLQSCKELVYLELDHCVVRDYTPLLGCTALEDLNLNDYQWKVSIEPIKQMTWLKNLWVPTRSYTEKMELIEALPNTRVEIADPATAFVSPTQRCPDGTGWRNLKNYYDMRDMLNEGTNGWLDSINKRYME